VAPEPRIESRAAALSLKTQTWLGRRKPASGASDLEAFRPDEHVQLQYCTDHIGTEATTASNEAASQPEHRTGTSTREYRQSDMRLTTSEVRSNRALSAYSSLLNSCCSAALTRFLLRVASACECSSAGLILAIVLPI